MQRKSATAVILGLTLLLPLMVGRASAREDGHGPGQPSAHLYVMFIPGLCGWQYSDPYCHGHVGAGSRARGTFSTLILALSAAHIQYTPLYFSYNPAHSDYYTVGDTHQAIAISTDALEKELRQVYQRDPQASFDLVGHSLGGVVAASWAVTDGRRYGLDPSQGLLERVGSIVTFDSPLKGIRTVYTSNLVAQLFGGAVWYSLQPNEETIKEIMFFPDSWWRTVGHLHTVANVFDRIVPADEASLGDTKLVQDNACNRDILFFKSCHGAVLTDTTLNRWVVAHWLTPALPRPTATPTPLPTPTAAASPVPTFPAVTPVLEQTPVRTAP